MLRWLDVRRLAVLLLLVALFAMGLREAYDSDMWWHLATGRYIVEQRTIPRHDVFSYTVPDHRWFTHEWLTQVGMYGLHRMGGMAALIVAAAAVVALTFALVYVRCVSGASLTAALRGEGRPFLAIPLILLGAVASAVTWGPRPQLLNGLLMALFLLLLARYRRDPTSRVAWAFPPLTVLWANLHSGFYLGLGLLTVVLVGDGVARILGRPSPRTLSSARWCRLALILLLCVLASVLNPNGYHMLLYPFDTLGSQAMQVYIQEWASPDFHRYEYWLFAALLLGGAAALILSRRRLDLTDLFLFLGFGFAGLVSARHIPLFAVAAAPVIYRALSGWWAGFRRTALGAAGVRGLGWAVVNWALLLVLVAAAGLRLSDVLAKDRRVEQARYPVAALAYAREHGLAEQRVYNSYNWGGYLVWQGVPVFIDGRADVYGDRFMHEYMWAYWLLGDWRAPLDRYDVDYVLIESGLPFARLLEEARDWTRVYRDDVAVIFVRNE